MTRRRVAILISGRGSNMNALIDAARAANYPAEIALVLANRPDAAGLERAKATGIETEVIASKGFPSREAFDEALDAKLKAAGIELSWEGIRRALAGQDRVTVTLKRADGKTVHIRKTTRAEPRQQAIYDALGISDRPGRTEKTVA